jgi:hypothetical protein
MYQENFAFFKDVLALRWEESMGKPLIAWLLERATSSKQPL